MGRKMAAVDGHWPIFSALSPIIPAMNGYIGKPSRAKRIAAAATSPNGMVPNSSRTVIQASGADGTIVLKIPLGMVPLWFF